MEIIIKILAYALIAMIVIGAILYIITLIVEAFSHADTHFPPSNRKSELHCRDRYEVAEKIKKNR